MNEQMLALDLLTSRHIVFNLSRPEKSLMLLAPLAKKAWREVVGRGLKSPNTLWLPATSGRVTAAQLLEGIPHLPEGVTELVDHPGLNQAVLDREYPDWNFDWPGELAAVTAPEVRESLVRENIQLTRYSELS